MSSAKTAARRWVAAALLVVAVSAGGSVVFQGQAMAACTLSACNSLDPNVHCASNAGTIANSYL